MFTTSLIALSWYRPSMDFLSLRSRPASVSSRIYFSFASCFEVSVSRTVNFSCKPLIDLTQVFIYSFFTLRLHHAPAVRLIDSSASRSSTPSIGTTSRPSRSPPPSFSTTATTSAPRTLDPPELLDSLSLSSKPIPLRTWRATGPVFGYSSLRPTTLNRPSPPASSTPAPTPAPQSHDEEDEDAMDWIPTASLVRPELASRGVLPARKVLDATTGLETLLERTNIDSSESRSWSSLDQRRRILGNGPHKWSWGWVYALSLIPLVAVMYYHLLR
jgi:hypothetical protein